MDHAHSALICGSTGSGKTKFILDLLEKEYNNFFTYIIIICPTLDHNKTYKRKWLIIDDGVFLVNPHNDLDRTLKSYYEKIGKLDDSQVLFIIDDCSALNRYKKEKYKCYLNLLFQEDIIIVLFGFSHKNITQF